MTSVEYWAVMMFECFFQSSRCGLHHAPFAGASIMSYHPGRSIQWRDAVNIRNNFRCNLFTLQGC